jgi:hypothetical protein
MTDIDALERVAMGRETVVTLAVRMQLHLAIAELREARRRLAPDRPQPRVQPHGGTR